MSTHGKSTKASRATRPANASPKIARRRYTPAFCRKHAEEYVALSLDSKYALAWAPTGEEFMATVDGLGLKPGTFAIKKLPPWGVSLIL